MVETHSFSAPAGDQTIENPARRNSVPNTIALVDDDRNILTSVSIALEAEGYTVRC